MKFCLLAAALLLVHLPARGETRHIIKDADAIRAIVGEAGGEGHPGMLAVACAIRHRGTLRGVYGLTNSSIYHQSAKIWRQARAAWAESTSKDTVRGATHWGTIEDVETGTYSGMVCVAVVGKHYFFRL